MALHPVAEAYRQARAAGDDTKAAAIMIEAHSGGPYNSRLIDQIHEVGRMTRSELAAPAEPLPVSNQTAGIVNNIYLNGHGS